MDSDRQIQFLHSLLKFKKNLILLKKKNLFFKTILKIRLIPYKLRSNLENVSNLLDYFGLPKKSI